MQRSPRGLAGARVAAWGAQGTAPGTGVEEDTAVAEGSPGLSPPRAVTPSPLPPTAPAPSRALSLTPAPSAPQPSAPALGEEEEAHQGAGSPCAELEPGQSQVKLFSCSGAGETHQRGHRRDEPPRPTGTEPRGPGTLRALPSAQPSTPCPGCGHQDMLHQ